MAEKPVTVLTGFLGAGKTTLLRGLLESPHGQRLALIVNELGQAGIDEAPDASFLELTEGCVCCLRNPELLSALDELSRRDDVDRVLLETTGLADPLALTWTLARPELSGKARADAVITVVDPLSFSQVQHTDEWQSQVQSADLVVLSKSDLASKTQLALARDAVEAIQPGVRMLPSDQVPMALILDVDPGRDRGAGRERGVHSDFGVVTVSDGSHHLDALEDLLESLPAPIFRAKGIVDLTGGRWASFHVVGGRLDLRLGVAPPSHGQTRMTFFGRGLEQEAVRALLEPSRAG